MNIKHHILWLSLLTGSTVTGWASADADSALRGASKGKVETMHGSPEFIEGPVGEPPITKWVYGSFVVVFEYDHVVHSYNRDHELERRPSSSVAPRPELRAGGDVLNMPQ